VTLSEGAYNAFHPNELRAEVSELQRRLEESRQSGCEGNSLDRGRGSSTGARSGAPDRARVVAPPLLTGNRRETSHTGPRSLRARLRAPPPSIQAREYLSNRVTSALSPTPEAKPQPRRNAGCGPSHVLGMQDAVCGFPRIKALGSSVNRGQSRFLATAPDTSLRA